MSHYNRPLSRATIDGFIRRRNERNDLVPEETIDLIRGLVTAVSRTSQHGGDHIAEATRMDSAWTGANGDSQRERQVTQIAEGQMMKSLLDEYEQVNFSDRLHTWIALTCQAINSTDYSTSSSTGSAISVTAKIRGDIWTAGPTTNSAHSATSIQSTVQWAQI